MSSISKILQFAKINDEPVVLCSENSEEDFVIMSLDKYKELEQQVQSKKTKKETSNLSKEEILRRINKDIELWRRKQQESRKTKKIELLEQELKDLKRIQNSSSAHGYYEEISYDQTSNPSKNNHRSASSPSSSELNGKRKIPQR